MKFYNIFVLGFFFFFFVQLTFSYDGSIKIITRSEWGANEEYRYKDSAEWKAIFAKWAEAPKVVLTLEQEKAELEAKVKEDEINSYLIKNYRAENTLAQTIPTENGRSLVWPIQKTTFIKGIVIHHTEAEYNTSLEWIQAIYKYHALSKWRWDIGYNYVIWYNGEIFEWRAGWDYVVWAHALYNNRTTIGISVMGNMQNHDVTQAQLLSLQKLILFLSNKYWIDLSKKVDFHKECKSKTCISPIASFSSYPIVWHRDVWTTSCPGEYLYKQLGSLIQYLTPDTKGLKTVMFWQSAPVRSLSSWLGSSSQSDDDLLTALWKLEYALDAPSTDAKKQAFQNAKIKVLTDLKFHLKPQVKKETSSFEDTKYIKIRLSYPWTWGIDITNGYFSYKIQTSGTWILVNGVTKSLVKISSWTSWFLTITSWQRIPTWDTKKMYNDNTFRWNLIIYVKNGNLVVVNELTLSGYLAWLWEISDGANEEKAKTILISARTYARYYMENERKFPWEFYDGSDNPDEFQRYLWYGLEVRSPVLKKLVQETKNYYITYNGNIIKPWYFSSSNGKTLSFFDYCIQWWKSVSICKVSAKKYPFLQAVDDYGGIWKQKSGHWVWISWIWATYFADRWWSAPMIISYFLKWVRVQVR